MLSNTKPLYSYSDVTIIPSRTTSISSRSECNPYVPGTNSLPIFTAPMSTVVGEKSMGAYYLNNIIPILPRSVDLGVRERELKAGYWVAFSLGELENLYRGGFFSPIDGFYRICLDIANGHMDRVLKIIEDIRSISALTQIMVGNIANPETIKDYMEAGVNYARLSIGTGTGCITSSNTGVHFPMASLISETRRIRDEYIKLRQSIGRVIEETKIIADGGIRGYADVIKALALGADYVMIGGLFAGCLEAEGPYYLGRDEPEFSLPVDRDFPIQYSDGTFYVTGKSRYNYDTHRNEFLLGKGEEKHVIFPRRRFYGMASKSGQRDISGGVCKTAEGIEKEIPITITLKAWSENMIHYLRSAMSYCDCKELKEIYEKMEVRIMSPLASNSFNK